MVRTAACAIIIFLSIALPTASPRAQETTEFLVTWSPSPEVDVIQYIIYRSTIAAGPFVAIDSVDASTHSYIDDNLAKNIRYYYRLVAKNAAGDRSALSSPVSGFTISQAANAGIQNLCKITTVDSLQAGSRNVHWSTTALSIGFVQFDTDAVLDSMSDWDNTYGQTHASVIDGLLMPRTYFVRAASYDSDKNMTVSSVDTIDVAGEPAAPPTAPLLSIYPVPYHRSGGTVTLANLPEGGAVSVFTENGVEVWHASVGSETQMTWNGQNRQGSAVASGVYYVVTRNASGAVVDKRAIMIVN